MPGLESLKQSILSECAEDHVGLWSVVRDAEEYLPKQEPTAVRDHVLQLLHELLAAKEIQAGYPTPDGSFRVLQVSPEKIVEQIEAEWPAGHRPRLGEGLWFTKAN